MYAAARSEHSKNVAVHLTILFLIVLMINGIGLINCALSQIATPQQQSEVLDELGTILDEQNRDADASNPTQSDSNSDQAGLPSDHDTSLSRSDPSLVEGPRGYLKIPSPRPEGWVVDLTGKITDDELEKINALCTEVYEKSGSELTCVLIPSTGGQNWRKYATNLFNDWNVGNRFRNNGMLIFVALDDGAAEVILGEGVDNDTNVLQARKLMDTIMVPRFANGEVGAGVYSGARACATQAYSIAHLESPKDLLDSKIRKSTGRRTNWLYDFGPIPWIIGGVAVGGVGLVGASYWWRYGAKTCDHCREKRTLLTEEQDDKFLDPPEIVEERIGSVDYDVWACLECETVLKLRYGKLFSRYTDCPQCDYKTRLRIERTLVQPTTVNGGRVRVIEECENCTYHKNYVYATPRLPKPSSSGIRSGGRSSGGSWGGGGGRRSSGFGGGRSAGRGASGRW